MVSVGGRYSEAHPTDMRRCLGLNVCGSYRKVVTIGGSTLVAHRLKMLFKKTIYILVQLVLLSFQYWKNAMKTSLTGIAEVNILKDFNKLTLDIIGETAFGYRFDTLISGENKISQAVETLLRGGTSVTARFLRRIIPFYDKLPTQHNKMIAEAIDVTDSVVKQV